jgi:thiol-disulfide isomerase/thioredoxin
MSAIVFSSPTCEPCKALKPVFDDLKEEFNTINWSSINIREDPGQLTQLYNIKQVPSMVVISKDGIAKTYTGRDVATYYRLVRSIT